MKHMISTASGRFTAGEVCAAVRRAIAAPPGTEFKSSLATWWPATREEILAQFRESIHDRINRRGHLIVRRPPLPAARLQRRARAAGLTCECRWCGTEMSFIPCRDNRFCEPSCRRSFHS